MFPRSFTFCISIATASLVVQVFSSQVSAQGAKSSGRQAPAAKPATPPPAQPSAPAAGSPQEKIDVTDLENKYWTSKDTDFSVVQNRLYSKSGRVAASLLYGSMVNDAWSEGTTYGVDFAYYFNDRYGIQGTYSSIDSRNNKATSNLTGQLGFPNHNKMKGFYGASFVFVPLYAKMSLMNQWIIYFDMSFAVGAGMQTYDQQRSDGNVTMSTPAVTFEVSEHFFLSRNFALRVDVRNRWYKEDVAWYRPTSVPAGSSRTASTDSSNTTLVLLGLTYLF